MRPFMIVAAFLLAVSGLAAPAVAGDLKAEDSDACGPEAVTVLVDAEALEGDLDVRCVDVTEDSTVLDAVTAAKFDVEGTTEYGSSVVCRVDGAPNEQAEPCDSMPAADAYWASYIGSDDGWEFAQEAVDAQSVAGGDVVALVFQDGSEAQEPQLSPAEAADSAESATDDGGDSDDGTPWMGVVIGAAVVVLLALVLLWLLRRRRATD